MGLFYCFASGGYPWATRGREIKPVPDPNLSRVGCGQYPRVKIHARTQTRRVGYPTDIRTRGENCHPYLGLSRGCLGQGRGLLGQGQGLLGLELVVGLD
jgi:hypothetical protein